MKTQLANPVICTNYRGPAREPFPSRAPGCAAGTMGDAAPGGTRPPGASFTIEYLLSGRGDPGGPCAPPASSTSPPPAPRPPAEPGDKPAQSYIALISTAILSSPEKKLLLSDIYQWIMDKYPYFKNKVRVGGRCFHAVFRVFYPPIVVLGQGGSDQEPSTGAGLRWGGQGEVGLTSSLS